MKHGIGYTKLCFSLHIANWLDMAITWSGHASSDILYNDLFVNGKFLQPKPNSKLLFSFWNM